MFDIGVLLDRTREAERAHAGYLFIDEHNDLFLVAGPRQFQQIQRFGPAADRHVLNSHDDKYSEIT